MTLAMESAGYTAISLVPCESSEVVVVSFFFFCFLKRCVLPYESGRELGSWT